MSQIKVILKVSTFRESLGQFEQAGQKYLSTFVRRLLVRMSAVSGCSDDLLWLRKEWRCFGVDLRLGLTLNLFASCLGVSCLLVHASPVSCSLQTGAGV